MTNGQDKHKMYWLLNSNFIILTMDCKQCRMYVS